MRFIFFKIAKIEDTVDMLQVDFANKRIGGGVLGRVSKYRHILIALI